ncbi:MAG: tryptophan halogenase family protein [Colwellia sp.]
MSQPKKIIIVGGGTAGWMTASLLHKAWGNKSTEILLIESDVIAKIGVGEGSTPALKLFFEHLNITEQEWMPYCSATYKCGISFPNWSEKPGFKSYIHPFYSQADSKAGNAFIHNAKLRRNGLDVDSHPDKFWVQTSLAKAFKSPISKEQLTNKMDYGYHFDSALVGQFLKNRLVNLGIKHLVDTVTEVKLTDTGEIKSLLTKNNDVQHADLFIDCTGFSAELISKALNVNFIDYKDSLFNDRAIAIQSSIDVNSPIPSQTTSSALSSGWAWSIPLSNRYGNGYVYSSKYISDANAETELRQHIGSSCNDFPARVLHMKLGRVEKHWHKNVLAVGLSQGFIEPLEATALMLIQHTVENFINSFDEMITESTYLERQQDTFNNYINEVFENIKDYIVAHYRVNSRTDSQYWIDNRNNTNISTRLTALLAAWDLGGEHFEAALDEHQAELTYFAPSWYCLFAGKGRFPEILTKPKPDTIIAPSEQVFDYCQKVKEHFIDHRLQLKSLYGEQWSGK